MADYLVERYNFVRVSLADPLKRFCREVFQFTDGQLWGPSEKRNQPDMRYPQGWHRAPEGSGAHDFQGYLTPRYALQQLGTDWGRNCYPNVWVDYALRIAKRLEDRILCGDSLLDPQGYTAQQGLVPLNEYSRLPQEINGVVIPDVRFKNEIDAIKAAGGKVIRVKRDAAGLTGSAATHRSETEQDGIEDSEFDFVINNDGTLEDLRLQVQQVVRYFQVESEEEKRADTFVEALEKIGVDEVLLSGGLLADLLKKREEDVQAGRLMEYDESQKDIPPFKRVKKT